MSTIGIGKFVSFKWAGVIALFVTTGWAQNPVPQPVGPPSPQAVKPGGGDFVVKVYGANFVHGSVVNWNRQPRATTYISGHELNATILSSDIVTNTAGYITVTNPPPGGGVSSASWTLVEVHDPTPTIAPGKPKFHTYRNPVSHLLLADFNNDAIMDLADANGYLITLLTGDSIGDFTFSHIATYDYWATESYSNVAYGDFNGDGNLDLAFQGYFGFDNPLGLHVSLGQGDGSFKPGWQIDDGQVVTVLAGDFDRDGKLDLLVGDCCHTKVYLGNGDGTFRLFKTYLWGGYRLVADLNGDGKLDVLVSSDTQPSVLYTVLGNGDGTFQQPKRITAFHAAGCVFSSGVQITDFNNDGRLDVAFCTATSIGVMLSNGDGTFQKPKFYLADVHPQFSFAIGDFNSDGKSDLLVSRGYPTLKNGIEFLRGNGDGTFQPRQFFPDNVLYSSGELGIAVGDFNSDGLLDFIFQEGGYGFAEYLQKTQ